MTPYLHKKILQTIKERGLPNNRASYRLIAQEFQKRSVEARKKMGPSQSFKRKFSKPLGEKPKETQLDLKFDDKAQNIINKYN